MAISSFAKRALAVAVMAAGLSACGSDDDTVVVLPPDTLDFEVTVYNDTAAQPLSPVVVGIHSATMSLWSVGLSASVPLETMAEGGNAADLAAMFTDTNVAVLGAGAIGPGNYEKLMISAEDRTEMKLSLASMMVNTNDAFTGLNAIDVSGLMVGDSMSYTLPAYDAGTEANSEAMGSIPGPADSGEGFNAARDDTMNKVSRHPGLVTQADDAMSVLLPDHRISGTVGRVVITRTN
ncbi:MULTISPECIES: spondin domain-containing protein [unclassified Agarivorans]|uniref:spondin domain-containing protein n=1 Tax=unclassified Agarivorans TaxID=2636026 RepID=UPI0026E2BB9D|nr:MULTISPECIES: spondin domain-containing protein [unclassified Agarivorans]MDO6687229.1 spondin domain-containing protein [Agarivorans sp. 3_MG-2023]MDO6716844.1 spondin domain-containing protein [Agarivorans sp. 2_MG-2023]